MKMETKKMRLEDLKVNENYLNMRPVNDFVVSHYRQQYRNGAKFPLIIVDKKTNEIVSGNHRYRAMVKEFGKDHFIEVIVKNYKNECERLKEFAKENAAHGNPLSDWNKKRISIELHNLGESPEDITRIWNIPLTKLKKWFDPTNPNNCITEIGNGKAKKETVMPLKYGTYIPPDKKKIDQAKYNEHAKKDRGISVYGIINQLIRHLQNDWIKPGELDELEKLELEIHKYLENNLEQVEK